MQDQGECQVLETIWQALRPVMHVFFYGKQYLAWARNFNTQTLILSILLWNDFHIRIEKLESDIFSNLKKEEEKKTFAVAFSKLDDVTKTFQR